ncbi:MAG: hypothetical protein COA94_02335 [Rickettsiales bacterium]|nr:MAG: hypothetical protein COA94_02335 [Rickettsiales bacterium]
MKGIFIEGEIGEEYYTKSKYLYKGIVELTLNDKYKGALMSERIIQISTSYIGHIEDIESIKEIIINMCSKLLHSDVEEVTTTKTYSKNGIMTTFYPICKGRPLYSLDYSRFVRNCNIKEFMGYTYIGNANEMRYIMDNLQDKYRELITESYLLGYCKPYIKEICGLGLGRSDPPYGQINTIIKNKIQLLRENRIVVMPRMTTDNNIKLYPEIAKAFGIEIVSDALTVPIAFKFERFKEITLQSWLQESAIQIVNNNIPIYTIDFMTLPKFSHSLKSHTSKVRSSIESTSNIPSIVVGEVTNIYKEILPIEFIKDFSIKTDAITGRFSSIKQINRFVDALHSFVDGTEIAIGKNTKRFDYRNVKPVNSNVYIEERDLDVEIKSIYDLTGTVLYSVHVKIHYDDYFGNEYVEFHLFDIPMIRSDQSFSDLFTLVTELWETGMFLSTWCKFNIIRTGEMSRYPVYIFFDSVTLDSLVDEHETARTECDGNTKLI